MVRRAGSDDAATKRTQTKPLVAWSGGVENAHVRQKFVKNARFSCFPNGGKNKGVSKSTPLNWFFVIVCFVSFLKNRA